MWTNEIIFLHIGVCKERRGHAKGTGTDHWKTWGEGEVPSSTPCKAPEQGDRINCQRNRVKRWGALRTLEKAVVLRVTGKEVRFIPLEIKLGNHRITNWDRKHPHLDFLWGLAAIKWARMDRMSLRVWLWISSVKTTGWFFVLWKTQIYMLISEPHIRFDEQIFLDAQPIQTSS